MKVAQYLVIPEAGNPHGYFLVDREKSLRLHVKKVFEDNTQATFNYQFFYLDSRGHTVRKTNYKAFSYKNNISEADHTRIAIWFLTGYFSYRELHYCFPEYGGSAISGYYPVFGRHPARNVFELQWD
ncbi:MAG: hypothetical protein EOP44_06905 [Sphingobacteriaceae bacterium]|nr:MAG: hypothetical protein EOP44_06905 [Sphingobacteriaceae bacterium]